MIDTQEGRILHTRETDNDLKTRHPYKAWLEKMLCGSRRIRI